MSILTKKKKDIVKECARNNQDTGSVEVQVALLSSRIDNLTEHLKAHKNDFSSRRGLLILVGRRRRLLDYLKAESTARYEDLIKKLDLRK